MRQWICGVVVLVVLALSAPAFAQTPHPCDVVPAQDQSFSGPVKAGFCWDGKDKDGLVTAASLTTVKVFLDSNLTPTVTGIPVLVTPTANIAGMKYYETAYFTPSVGSHSVRATIGNSGGESIASLPFAFTQVVNPPSQAIGLRTVK